MKSHNNADRNIDQEIRDAQSSPKCAWCNSTTNIEPSGVCSACQQKYAPNLNPYIRIRSFFDDFVEPFLVGGGEHKRECRNCSNDFYGDKHRYICRRCEEQMEKQKDTVCSKCGGSRLIEVNGFGVACPNCLSVQDKEITKSRKEQLMSFLTVKMCEDPEAKDEDGSIQQKYVDVLDILRKSVELHQHEIVNGSVYDHAKHLSDSVAVLEAQFLRKATAMESMKKMLQSPEKYSIYELMQEAWGGGYLMNINFQETPK